MKAGVYFFLRPFQSPDDAGYQHRSIVLAEGLKALGIPVFASEDYWRLRAESSATLFTRAPRIRPEDCDILVAEHVYFDAHRELPAVFRKRQRKSAAVYIDASDSWRSEAMPWYGKGPDLVLRCHQNARFDYGANVRPWAFGLSQRILDALRSPGGPAGRRRRLLCNNRTPHPVRRAAQRIFFPLVADHFEIDARTDGSPPEGPEDLLMWEQSGRRHHPSYYARLAESAACSAFGGYFVPSFSRSLDSLPLRAAHKVFSIVGASTGTVVQFDSWRFWESLAAGCVTLHVDFDRYGCRLPAMPVNGTHYIGVDFSRPGEAAARMTRPLSDLAKIAGAGREWALDNYSPEPTARRFLQLVREVS